MLSIGASKKVRILLPLLLLGCSTALAREFKRFEFQHFGGFTVSGDISLNGDDGVHHGSVHINSSYNIGATCVIKLKTSFQQQLDLTGGLVFRF